MRLSFTIPKLDFVIGFVVPLGIFLEAGSPILLATSRIAQENLAVPLSLVAMPIALTIGTLRLSSIKETSTHKAFLCGLPFFLYVFLLALASAIFVNPMAIVAGVQWLLPFFWAPYFLSLRSNNFARFAEGFVLGSLGGATYYFSAGTLEIIQYGALQDFGRLTQNFILPGQYQIAVYVPTALSYSVLLSTVFIKNGIVNRSRRFMLILNIFGLFAISFTASREGMLVFLVGHLLIASIEQRSRMAISLFAVSAFTILLVLNLDQFMSLFAESDFRLLNKISALHAAENLLAGRDDMINDVLQIIRSNTLFGTHFLPPQSFSDRFAVSAPSAHNIYVDAFLWTGLFGGIFFLVFSAAFLFQALNLILRQLSTQSISASAGVAVLSVTFILLSNNVNVPWRQPLTAPIGAFLFALCFNYQSILRR